jgi:hypothetical protein
MILVWGLPRDPPTAQIYAALCRRRADVELLDQRTAIEGDADMSVDGELSLTLRTSRGSIDLSRCTAAYVRPYDFRELSSIRRAGPGSQAWERALLVDQMLIDWADLTDATVVNRPSAMASNASKAFHAGQLRGVGFSVPDTIITTDPDAVRAFRERHGRVVYKSISGVRSIVSELTDERMEHLEDVRWCPTQFQELVPGTDHRVHVVGEEIFAASIESDATDYRYGGLDLPPVKIRPAHLPDEMRARCVAITRVLGLAFSGIDLRRTPDGRWYCFEVNPSPGFTYYQDATEQGIDDAVARLLAFTA